MFTGLISEFAKVKNFDKKTLSLIAKHKPKLGDSIAVNGACLTVTKIDSDGFEVELSQESQKCIALENYQNKVHIEPALRLSDRIDGHLVQGHIDGIGKITNIQKKDNSNDFFIQVPNEIKNFMIPKGSVAIDGVSLTINEIKNDIIRLSIIPYTFKNTLFKNYKINQRVNVESDLLVRTVHELQKPKLSWQDVDKIMSLY